MAEKRVQTRVEEGGHNIPKEVIRRRYYGGLTNLFSIYHDICDLVLIYDNSRSLPELIYEKPDDGTSIIHNSIILDKIKGMIL